LQLPIVSNREEENMKSGSVNTLLKEIAGSKWIHSVVTLLVVIGLGFHPCLAHDIDVDRGEGAPDYAERLARARYLEQHKMSEGLRHRATIKVQRAALEAAGVPPTEAARRLYGGPAYAFPFPAPADLKSSGTVRTLTVLVDFKDHRAGNALPSQKDFYQNTYGIGTQTAQGYVPYESVHAYYSRASEGKVDLQGDVLDWYHFPKNRKEYEPAKAPPGPDQDRRQMFLDNKALFDMAVEVLKSRDDIHDYSQYDNDNDGDIDLLTILYAGPSGSWNSFWWAYRWQFFVPEASTITFDGKRIKQFVFQFIDMRPNTNDFNPRTLIHETGHAFGLADYYDYDPTIGPSGGVGGLDMMDGNWGNHCAFSRWLLDWIKPEVIGSGAPSPKALLASGVASGTGAKAVVVFPGLTDADAPSGELFIIENRHRVGNDGDGASMPGDGLLIWHVDATVNSSGDDFEFDNSFTNHKILKLVRADSSTDFDHRERATGGNYFNSPKKFTATSTPNSNGLDGKPTHVSIDDIGGPGSVMSAKVGIDGAPVTRSLAALPTARAAAAPVKTSIDSDELEKLESELATATADEIRKRWQSVKAADAGGPDPEQATLIKQMILIRWASKTGKDAVEALLEVPDLSFVSRTYPEVMAAWVTNDVDGATKWYFSDKQTRIRNSQELRMGTKSVKQMFTYSALSDPKQALTLVDSLNGVKEIYGALAGIQKAETLLGIEPSTSESKYRTLTKNRAVVEKLEQLRSTIQAIDVNSIGNIKQRNELKTLLPHGMLQ
jgi:M6 family metalloprotease-like protein